MKALKNLDLYTVLILVCVVLLPVCGWWCMKTQETIVLSEKALREAGPGGLLAEIGALQKKIEIVNQNRGGSDPMNARQYFDGQILAAAANSGDLKDTDYGIDGPRPDAKQLPGSKQKVVDHVVDVQWKNRDLALKLDFIEALLWNCESGAGVGSATNLQSIWKLRELTVVNLTEEKALRAYDTPPPELQDKWRIQSMKFARREPAK